MTVGDFTPSEPTALALTAGWTDKPVTLTNSGNVAALNNASVNLCSMDNGTFTSTAIHYGYTWGGYWYPYLAPLRAESERRPVKLSMAEVERLRVAAKKDKALRETLEKFTDHIEVIVDFGKAA